MDSGIYCHLPICKSRCIYCDFYSQTDMSIEDRLIDGIVMEIRRAGIEYNAFRAGTVYLGGGTPSCFKVKNIRKLLESIGKQFIGERNDKIEITIEINPDDISPEKLIAYKDAGISRISLGIQSFNDRELKFLGRRHDARQNHQAIRNIRQAGFENFSLDLIFALPKQTAEDFNFSLNQALAYHPAHVSIYCLTYEHGTPLYNMLKSGEINMLDDNVQADFFRAVMRRFSQEGYIQYELSNFAIAGYECRHNINYWKMGNYLGFGPSAHSHFDNRRWANFPDIEKYLQTTTSGHLLRLFQETITSEQQAEEFLMLSLRLKEGVDLEKHKKLAGQNLLRIKQKIISSLLKSGMAEIRGTFLRLTENGKLVADEITAQLM